MRSQIKREEKKETTETEVTEATEEEEVEEVAEATEAEEEIDSTVAEVEETEETLSLERREKDTNLKLKMMMTMRITDLRDITTRAEELRERT